MPDEKKKTYLSKGHRISKDPNHISDARLTLYATESGEFTTGLPPVVYGEWQPGDAPPILFVHGKGCQPLRDPVLQALRAVLPRRMIVAPLYQNNDVPHPTPGELGWDDAMASLQVRLTRPLFTLARLV